MSGIDSNTDCPSSTPERSWYPEDSEEFVELYGPPTSIPTESSNFDPTRTDDIKPPQFPKPLVRTESCANAATANLSKKSKQSPQAANLTMRMDDYLNASVNLSKESNKPPQASKSSIPKDSYANAANINPSNKAKKPQLSNKRASLSQHPTRPSFSSRRQVK